MARDWCEIMLIDKVAVEGNVAIGSAGGVAVLRHSKLKLEENVIIRHNAANKAAGG